MNAQTAITTQTEGQLIRWCEPGLPSKLSTLLDQKLTFTDLPVIGPVSAQALRDYVAACVPPVATPVQINRMITRVANMMPSPRGMTDDESDERMATIRHALRHHALPDLHAVFDAILRTCRFFPTIAEIEALIAPIRARRMARVNRAELLVMKHERQWSAPVTDIVPPAELADLRAKVAASFTAGEMGGA